MFKEIEGKYYNINTFESICYIEEQNELTRKQKYYILIMKKDNKRIKYPKNGYDSESNVKSELWRLVKYLNS